MNNDRKRGYENDGRQVVDLKLTSYRPPVERVCPTCGGKHVGRCSLNACSDVGRGPEWSL